jgi:alpha-glucosidase
MKRYLYGTFCLLVFVTLFSCTEDEFSVKSPDGKNVINLIAGKDGNLSYTVVRENTVLVPNSAIGVNSGDERYTFTGGLTFVDVITHKIDETYNLPTGKVKVYHNKCNEKVYRFRNKAGNIINIECRAYDDGVAFRYTFDKEGDITIVSAFPNK